ncbi:hypothetical protein G6F35_016796 [Rhizopus arrhizus]|nr:hypothetical protein G6F31_018893 [Rhizopus arrhizus]KAG1173047.1 hypothetical protein G6F35_016796 [Rhizopus arrhizus]
MGRAAIGGYTQAAAGIGQAGIRRWQSAAGKPSARSPVGQQMSSWLTLAGIGAAAESPRWRGRLSTTSNISGSAVTAPYCPGSGVPSGRPTHTPTV